MCAYAADWVLNLQDVCARRLWRISWPRYSGQSVIRSILIRSDIMAPVTQHTARGHVPGGSQHWESHRTQGIAVLVKSYKLWKLKKPDKQTEGDPGEPNASPPALPSPVMDMEMVTQGPLTLPEPPSPNEQPDLEFWKHASIALQGWATREKEEDKEILELLTLLEKKVSSMKQRSCHRLRLSHKRYA